MEELYNISKISRQGYNQANKRLGQASQLWLRIKEVVIDVKKDYPRISARKIHYMLQIKEVGINRFEQFVSQQGLGVKKQRSYTRTTYRGKTSYPNLTNGIHIQGINRLWVSDLTYYLWGQGTFYLVFILDVYSRRIVGYSASENMLCENNQKVLSMAMKIRKQKRYNDLIHHSDKGSQYGSTSYIDMLKAANIQISMAENCLENPYAERINGTIKNDYLRFYEIQSLRQLELALVRSVKLYNNCPHGELGNISPIAFEQKMDQIPANEHPVMNLYDFRSVNQINKQF